jgi:dipeptidyl-peptidase-4
MADRMMRAICLLLVVLLGAGANAPSSALTLDTVFSKGPPWGRMIDRVAWSPDGKQFLYVRLGQDPSEALPLMLYDVASGTSRVWLEPSAFGTEPRTPQIAGWSHDGSQIALLEKGALYVARVSDARLRQIGKDVDDALWAPRTLSIAYAHDSDLYVARIGARIIRTRVTHGGRGDAILNGTLDWVYPEELGIEHGFRWSPDEKSIAYLRMDERPVTRFPIVDFLKVDNSVDYQRYPLAGERNPRVSLRVVNLASGADRLLYDAAPHDEYVANFDWTPHEDLLEAEILDRHERDLRVDAWRSGRGSASTLYRQHSNSWVDVVPLPFWLAGGRSVWQLDRDTTAGVYLRARDGSLRKLTGAYRIFDVYGVRNATVYASAAYPTRRDRSLLAISLSGSVRNLTSAAGAHRVVLAQTLNRFVDEHSTLNDPPQSELVDVATLRAKTLAPSSDSLKSAMLPTKMVEVPSQYGPLDATMIEPPAFDSNKKYPVVVYVYGGPDAPTTADTFGYQLGLYHQLLAREGFIVFSIDGPASQVDSDAHVRLLLRNFGPGSLLGQEIGARYLGSLPYVDAKRIGIWGWSFGGYETCYALTHSTLFAAGAAVAPVTDWHLYDTIYTERYMGLPKEDPKVYDRSSVLNAAGNLAGPLLIQHGTADDNVHMSNTMQLLQKFILAHEERVLFYAYPRKKHPIPGVPQRRSVFAHMLNFWKVTLKP